MSFELDDSIRDDFLAEANELVEALGEELLELEKRPDDRELLDSIFRAFHTVKGGAGFLDVPSLVEICHAAEEVFDALRKGSLNVDTQVMDAVLGALDETKAMLSAISEGGDVRDAPPELVSSLRGLAEKVESGQVSPAAETAPSESEPQAGATDDGGQSSASDPAERAFEAMVARDKRQAEPEDFSDDEIANLMEQVSEPDESAQQTPPVSHGNSQPDATADDGLISEDEFENLLDELEQKKGEQEKQDGPAAASTPEANTNVEPVAVASSARSAAEDSEAQDRPAQSARSATPPEQSIRVQVSRLDSVMNLVGELVLVRNRLTNLGTNLKDEELKKAVANLDLVTADLQTGVMQTRMQPIRKVFSRFPRLARDVARSLDKEIELEMSGEDTDLDKNLVEALADPLVHLVRNAMDHGIESPEVREKKGKPRQGTVKLSAEQQGDHIAISISDDGAGMDADVLRTKAVQKGVLTREAADKLEDGEALDLIFNPGFSTREQVSDLSGRGVGMDVVKTSIASLNGNVEIESKQEIGTTITVTVPLTLAILPTLMVTLDKRTFAFPLSHVVEVFSLASGEIRRISGKRVIVRRGRPLPLCFLAEHFGIPGSDDAAQQFVVVLQIGTQQVGFVTDNVIGQEEVVIKPLGKLLSAVSTFAGATITGDGNIALIFDVSGLTAVQKQAA